MNRLGWGAVELVARLLAPDEREAVLGDLHEAGENNWGGLFEVLGLFFRRHVTLWREWRPWLAIIGVSAPSSLTLMGLSVSISLGYLQLIHSGGFQIDRISGSASAELVRKILLLVSWAWAGGFVIGSVSRKTLWASGLAMVMPCLFCFTRFNIEALSKFCLLLFLPPVVLGMIQGLCRISIRRSFAFIFTAAIVLLLVLSWSGQGEGGWPIRTWVLNTILCWPLGYVVATAQKTSKQRSTLA